MYASPFPTPIKQIYSGIFSKSFKPESCRFGPFIHLSLLIDHKLVNVVAVFPVQVIFHETDLIKPKSDSKLTSY